MYDAHSGRTMSLLESGRGGSSGMCIVPRIYDMRARCTCECAPVCIRCPPWKKKMPSGSKRPSRFVSILGFPPELHMSREFVEVSSTVLHWTLSNITARRTRDFSLETIFAILYKFRKFSKCIVRISEWGGSTVLIHQNETSNLQIIFNTVWLFSYMFRQSFWFYGASRFAILFATFYLMDARVWAKYEKSRFTYTWLE